MFQISTVFAEYIGETPEGLLLTLRGANEKIIPHWGPYLDHISRRGCNLPDFLGSIAEDSATFFLFSVVFVKFHQCAATVRQSNDTESFKCGDEDRIVPFFSQTLTGAVLRLYSPTPAPVIAATRNSYSLPSSRSGTVALSPAIGKSLTFSQSPPAFLFSI